MAFFWPGTDSPGLLHRSINCWPGVAHQPARQQLLQALFHLGDQLDRLTRTPGLRHLPKMIRAPGAIAGIGSLQHFLEVGCKAFADLQGPAEFLATADQREAAWISSLFDLDAVACETKMLQLLALQGEH